MNNKEVRSFAGTVDVSGDGKTVSGYAAVFNSLSQDLGGFNEVIRHGAFSNSLKKGADVRALFDHDSSKVLGRSVSGTLRLTQDDKGLRYEIDLPDTSTARDLTVLMRRGDVTGSSFGFTVPSGGDKWRKEADRTVRELHNVDLVDVSVVTYPAYTAASATVRSLEQFQKEDSSARFRKLQRQSEAEAR